MREHKVFLLATVGSMLAAGACWAQAPLEARAYNWEDGEQVYAKVCAYCHETEIAPELFGRNLPAVYYSTIVRSGLRAMPAFREAEINDESLQALANFLANSPAKE